MPSTGTVFNQLAPIEQFEHHATPREVPSSMVSLEHRITVMSTHDASIGKCKAILIVEDEQVIRETLQIALELEGYKVFLAENGKDALELLPNIPRPCLIFLDLMMPVMNGWEFVATIEKNSALSEIPIVLVTAYCDQGKSLPTKGLIPKPVDLNLLYEVARQWCGPPEDHRE